MKNHKGQALVEFIVILPILLTIILGAVDFGNIIYKKYHLENDLDLIVDLYKQNKTNEINNYVNEKEISFKFNKKNNLTTITLSKNINIITPGLNVVLKNPYTIKVDRVIYEE